MTEQYIEDRGTSFRVRFPAGILEKRNYGSYATVGEAKVARDAFLASLGADDTIDYSDISIPENSSGFDDKPLTIPSGNVLVFSDLHVPHQNRTMLRRAIYVARKFFPQIEDFAVIGDSWDWTSLSKHPKDSPGEDMDECLEIGAKIYRVIGDYFKRGWICNGNHDARVGLKLDAPFTLQRVFNSAFGQSWPNCTMNISNLDYLIVDGERRWIIGHPSAYSGSGGKTPADIADIEGCNVATGHNHVIGQQQSKSGRFVGVDIGHMTEEDRHYYKFRRLTKYARWNAGFMVIANGYAHTYSERFTDWRSLGCE